MSKLIAIIIALASVLQAAAPSDTCKQETWITNGRVNAIVTAGNKVYIGGSFTQVGPFTGSGVPINSTTGLALPVFPKINGIVYAVCSDSNGGWFVGGRFASIEGVARNNIAHILSNGTIDPVWNPNSDSGVASLVVNGTRVYAGGSFTNIGGQNRRRIAALDAVTGTATAWNPQVNDKVNALAVSGTTVYAGGAFKMVADSSRRGIAAIDSATGLALGWNPNANGEVYSVAISGATVYAGGAFDSIGNQSHNHIAALDKTTGNALAWDPNANGPVRSIAISGTTVFSGGNFTNIGNQNRNHIAALDVITGNALAWNPNVDSAVRSITIIGTMVYVGGSFVNIGGQGRNYIAALDITSGNVLTWNPNANCPVNSIVVSGTTVYAGGEFTGIGGQSRSNIAALDVATGNATGWNPNANNSVFSFAVSGKSVYIGGKFTTIGGQNRRGIAAVDTVTGSVFDWDPSASDSCCIYSLAVNATTVYAGGYFQVIGGQFRNHIAALDVTTGNATAWNPNAGSLVYSLALSGTSVYVGGDFRTIGGQSRNFIASVDAATGNVLDWNPNSNKAVNSLAASGTTVYAGGNFDSIGGQSRNYIAALDASTGNILTWNAHASNYVYSLSLSGTTLYAGGSFDSMGGLFRNHIAAIDASTGNILSWNPNSDNFVYALAVSGTSIFAGGIFTDIGQGIGRAFFAQLGNFLSAPKLAAPANGSSGQPTGITLSWNAVSGASAYHLQLSLSPDFNMPLVDDSTLTVMSKTIGSLSNGATYYWRVSGSNTHGISLWSEIWNFSVIPQAPGAPLLLFPTNNALDVSTKPMVKWHRVNNTTSYYVLVAADSLFASIIFQDSTTIDTFKVCGQLANYTKYFWRVEAANAGGIGIWSSIYSFTTIVTIPSVVHLKAPEMGDTIKIDSVVLTWSKGVPQADLYSVEYASDSSFTVPTIDSSIIDTARLVRNLKNNSAIWWRVKSHNAAGWGDWSVKSMFAVKFISTRSGLSGLPKVFSFSISSMTGSIRYTLPKTEHVVFQIYSIKGQLQSEPLNKQQEAGYYTVNIHYGSIAAGSYLMVFRAGAYYQKKMVFLRK